MIVVKPQSVSLSKSGIYRPTAVIIFKFSRLICVCFKC